MSVQQERLILVQHILCTIITCTYYLKKVFLCRVQDKRLIQKLIEHVQCPNYVHLSIEIVQCYTVILLFIAFIVIFKHDGEG